MRPLSLASEVVATLPGGFPVCASNVERVAPHCFSERPGGGGRESASHREPVRILKALFLPITGWVYIGTRYES